MGTFSTYITLALDTLPNVTKMLKHLNVTTFVINGSHSTLRAHSMYLFILVLDILPNITKHKHLNATFVRALLCNYLVKY